MKADVERDVARHYASANLLDNILAALKAAGRSEAEVRPDDLAPFEELHIGGRAATEYLVGKLDLRPGDQVLDVGCGIGGAARFIAATRGCRVTGIDLTPAFIKAAQTLSGMVGLEEQTDFDAGSALDMPYDDHRFRAVISLHAAMNIADRPALYREMARVLKPGGVMGIFDVMKRRDDALAFPVPWAESPETSFLTTPDDMRMLLEDAGLMVLESEDRSDFAREFFAKVLAREPSSRSFSAPRMAMKRSREKLLNVLANIEYGRIAPVLMIAVKR